MVKGILADVDCEGHLRVLLYLMQSESRREFWEFLNLATPSFADLGLVPEAPDVVIWQKCQQEQLILLTNNRNAESPESLEVTIRTLGTTDSLPVFTLGDARRLLRDRDYAERAADKLLLYLFDIDKHRGSGRLYLP